MNKSEKQATVTVDNPIKTQQLAPHTLSIDTVQDTTTQHPAVWHTADAGTRCCRGEQCTLGIIKKLLHCLWFDACECQDKVKMKLMTFHYKFQIIPVKVSIILRRFFSPSVSVSLSLYPYHCGTSGQLFSLSVHKQSISHSHRLPAQHYTLCSLLCCHRRTSAWLSCLHDFCP